MMTPGVVWVVCGIPTRTQSVAHAGDESGRDPSWPMDRSLEPSGLKNLMFLLLQDRQVLCGGCAWPEYCICLHFVKMTAVEDIIASVVMEAHIFYGTYDYFLSLNLVFNF